MNRSEVYWILKEKLNNYKVKVNGRPYNKFYIPRDWEFSWLKTDSVFIRDFNEVYVCTKELVVRGKYDNLQINLEYDSMDSLEVGGG